MRQQDIVGDPKDYRWSGYGEAVAGGESARAGLGRLVRTETGEDATAATWVQVQAIYRCWLYDEGQEVRDDLGRVLRRGFAPEMAEMVINRQQGALARPVLVKMRLRHFTVGLAIGPRPYPDKVGLSKSRSATSGFAHAMGSHRVRLRDTAGCVIPPSPGSPRQASLHLGSLTRWVVSPRRVDGARKMKGVRWGGLVSMRDLRG